MKKEPAFVFELQPNQWFPPARLDSAEYEESVLPQADKLTELWTFS